MARLISWTLFLLIVMLFVFDWSGYNRAFAQNEDKANLPRSFGASEATDIFNKVTAPSTNPWAGNQASLINFKDTIGIYLNFNHARVSYPNNETINADDSRFRLIYKIDDNYSLMVGTDVVNIPGTKVQDANLRGDANEKVLGIARKFGEKTSIGWAMAQSDTHVMISGQVTKTVPTPFPGVFVNLPFDYQTSLESRITGGYGRIGFQHKITDDVTFGGFLEEYGTLNTNKTRASNIMAGTFNTQTEKSFLSRKSNIGLEYNNLIPHLNARVGWYKFDLTSDDYNLGSNNINGEIEYTGIKGFTLGYSHLGNDSYVASIEYKKSFFDEKKQPYGEIGLYCSFQHNSLMTFFPGSLQEITTAGLQFSTRF